MTGAAFLLLSVVGAVAPEELRAEAHVAAEYERIGRKAPSTDEPLRKAAATLAGLAAEEGAERASSPLVLASAVSAAAGHDPSPRAIVIRAASVTQAIATLLSRSDLADEAATHFGIATGTSSRAASLVLLLSDRRTDLEPFPRTPARGLKPQVLRGRLRSPLAKPQLYVTFPSGRVDKIPTRTSEEGAFSGRLLFPEEGRYTVEVMAHGPTGPLVTALFFAVVGQVSDSRAASVSEPPTEALAKRAILERVNALRRAHGIPELTSDPRLDSVATAYSQRMALENFFGHVAPDGSSAKSRLLAAGFRFRQLAENLGEARGPLEAHLGIELSPGHRMNLVAPEMRRLGVGIASRRRDDGTANVLLTEIVVSGETPSGNTLEEAYAAIAARRARLGLGVLTRDPTLEKIAARHAALALSHDTPEALLPEGDVHDQVFATKPDIRRAQVAVYVLDTVEKVADSNAVADPKHDALGIGLAEGSTPRHGAGKTWAVVIYTVTR